MSTQSSIRDSFFEECDDLLGALFEGLAQIEEGDAEPETINAVFRAVHSIKGGAGAFKLTTLVAFAHTFETTLDCLRSQKLDAGPDLVRVLLRAADQLANLVEAARDDSSINEATRDAVLAELEAYLDDDDQDEGEINFAPVVLDLGFFAEPDVPADREIKICFQPFARLYSNGHEPAYLIAALARLGHLTVALDLDAIPPLGAYQRGSDYLIWNMSFSSPDPEAAVSEVFEFVEGLCRLDITASSPVAEAAPAEAMPATLPASDDAAEQATIHPALPEPTAEAAPAPAAEKAPDRQGDGDTKGAKPTLRVDLERVDRLINTVGELIINQAMISQRISQLGLARGADIEADLEDYKLLARDLQEGVMAIRAQPVKALFQRMSRIVREASEATGKNVHLVTRGEATEVDKTVIERLADPLTHMIRNAVDHGLETPEKRAAAGKDPIGEIRLSATHKSGSVLIEISDDGAGLNRPKILEIAISKGLIPATADLPEAEIDKLLFLPGFSTATVVSNLSGRGVGMDVVKNAVQALGGKVAITSVPGKGTTFSIVLPLTLAVMDGMVISVAGETMVVPIMPILETIRPARGDIHPFGPDGRVLSIRGRYVPIVDVARSLGLRAAPDPDHAEILILVETENGGQCALRVDAIHDQRQVVIKSVAGNYGTIPGVSAATILGDGKIALILDTDRFAKADQAASDLMLEKEI
jgi:two-component system, chemotaxis family, sensor kinase CheA